MTDKRMRDALGYLNRNHGPATWRLHRDETRHRFQLAASIPEFSTCHGTPWLRRAEMGRLITHTIAVLELYMIKRPVS